MKKEIRAAKDSPKTNGWAELTAAMATKARSITIQPKPEATDPTPKPGETHSQKDEKGYIEYVRADLHDTKLICECGEIRWVAPGDIFQVTHCKPCTERRRKARRKITSKARRQMKAAERRAARAAQMSTPQPARA